MPRIDGGAELPHVDRKNLVKIIQFVVPGNPDRHPLLLGSPDLASQFRGQRFPQVRVGFRQGEPHGNFRRFHGKPVVHGKFLAKFDVARPEGHRRSDRLADERRLRGRNRRANTPVIEVRHGNEEIPEQHAFQVDHRKGSDDPFIRIFAHEIETFMSEAFLDYIYPPIIMV